MVLIARVLVCCLALSIVSSVDGLIPSGASNPCDRYGDYKVKIQNCCVGYEDGTCVKCDPGYGLVKDGNKVKCKRCTKGCAQCDGDVDTCQRPFVEDPNCNSNDERTGQCTGCKYGYFLSWDGMTCSPCRVENCYTCNAFVDQCSVCAPLYGLIDGTTCSKCKDSKCVQCDGDASYCNDCKTKSAPGMSDPTYYDKDAYGAIDGKCVKCPGEATSCKSGNVGCPDGYYSDPKTGGTSCKKCVAEGCEICKRDSPDECTLCNNGMSYSTQYSMVNGKCKKCRKYESYCGDQVECSDGAYLDDRTNSCKPCRVKNCRDCKKNGDSCDECKPGYGLTKKRQCDSCPDNCLFCSDPNTCTDCKDGYLLRNGKCPTKCPNNGFCDRGRVSCLPGYHYNERENSCDSCSDPYCFDCQENVDVCKSCGFESSGGTVTHYSATKAGFCRKCPKGAIYCGDDSDILCIDGMYYDSDSKSCRKLEDSNCVQSGKNGCTICQEMYKPGKDGTCVKL